jgi:hypothetical protein
MYEKLGSVMEEAVVFCLNILLQHLFSKTEETTEHLSLNNCSVSLKTRYFQGMD